MKNKINLPGFSAFSLVSISLQSYQTNELFMTSREAPIVLQAKGIFGGFRRLGLDPLPSSCSECRYECTTVSCGPNCRREECHDVCQSVLC